MFEEDEMDLWGDLADLSARKTIVMKDGQKELLDSENFFGRPVLGKIIILPRSAVHQFVYPRPWACISITDAILGEEKRWPIVGNDPNRVDILRMGFDDVEFVRDFQKPLTVEQAKQIWNFVAEIWGQVQLLMIHCHAGISRSPAIGKAISDVYQPDFSSYFDQLYSPNRLAYARMVEARSLK